MASLIGVTCLVNTGIPALSVLIVIGIYNGDFLNYISYLVLL